MRNLRRPLGLVPLIVLAACQAADQPIAGAADDPGEIPEYSIEQFLASTNVFGSSFSPTGDNVTDTGRLVYTLLNSPGDTWAKPVPHGENED